MQIEMRWIAAVCGICAPRPALLDRSGYLTFFGVHQYTGFSEILKRRGLRSPWSPSVVLRLLSSPILDDLAPREQSLL